MTQARILIVDDEPALLRSCRAVLESARFEVDTATSGAEALALIEQNP